MCMVVLLQGYVGASDAEAVKLSIMDLLMVPENLRCRRGGQVMMESVPMARRPVQVGEMLSQIQPATAQSESMMVPRPPRPPSPSRCWRGTRPDRLRLCAR
jgi:hypothetical protein